MHVRADLQTVLLIFTRIHIYVHACLIACRQFINSAPLARGTISNHRNEDVGIQSGTIHTIRTHCLIHPVIPLPLLTASPPERNLPIQANGARPHARTHTHTHNILTSIYCSVLQQYPGVASGGSSFMCTCPRGAYSIYYPAGNEHC